mgnify:CR=1 FL=1|tara:strand:+ start:1041 stop:1439 length:399 start_codon:yes stop_codon:yes gene_type:complete
MPVVNTKAKTKGNLVKREFWAEDGWNYLDVVCLEGTATSYVVGTVLGKITASGKFKAAVQSAADGSQTAAALVVEAVDVLATTDTTLKVMVRGPAVIAKQALVLDTTYDNDTKKGVVYASLEALNFSLETQV